MGARRPGPYSHELSRDRREHRLSSAISQSANTQLTSSLIAGKMLTSGRSGLKEVTNLDQDLTPEFRDESNFMSK